MFFERREYKPIIDSNLKSISSMNKNQTYVWTLCYFHK